MKVAILVPSFSKYSGDARVAELQAKEFVRKGDKIAIFALEGDLSPEGVEIYKLGVAKGSLFERAYRLLFFLDLPKILKWLPKLKEYDLVISHLYPMNWLAYLAKKFYRIPYVFYNHGTNPPELFPKLYERIYLWLYLSLNNFTTKNADSAISVSEYARKELREQLTLESTVEYNKIDTTIFHRGINGSVIREKLGLGNAPVMLFVGRIAPQKRIDLLIKVFKLVKQRVPSATLIIVGKHTYDYYSKIVRKMCGSSVIFVDSLPHEKLAGYYAACDLYVTTSYWESFNLPLVEAQACGKPVVAFDIGPHKEVINEKGMLVEKGDLYGFANVCTEYLSQNRELELLPFYPTEKKTICLVCSHGGHLTELLQLSKAFDGHETFFITYDTVRTRKLRKKYLLQNIGRNPMRFIAVLPGIFKIIRNEKPDLVVSTGAEIAIPVFIAAKLFHIETIYLESWCRIKEPSHTGRLVYPLSNIFLVQWKQLLRMYGKKAKYVGEVF